MPFHRQGNLCAIIIICDAEAAQAKGLSRVLARMNDPEISGILETNPRFSSYVFLRSALSITIGK